METLPCRIGLVAALLLCAVDTVNAQAAGPLTEHPVVAALGGVHALRELRSLSYTLEIEDLASGKRLRSAQLLDFQHRRVHRRDVKDGRESTRASNGAEGWLRDGGGLQALDAAAARELMNGMHYNFLFLFAQPETTLTPTAAAGFAADGRGYRVAAPGLIEPFLVATDEQGRIVRLRFDDGTEGREFDWQPVAGLRWPFQFELSRGGQAVRRGRFTDLRVNPPVPPGMFAGLPPRRARAP